MIISHMSKERWTKAALRQREIGGSDRAHRPCEELGHGPGLEGLLPCVRLGMAILFSLHVPLAGKGKHSLGSAAEEVMMEGCVTCLGIAKLSGCYQGGRQC